MAFNSESPAIIVHFWPKSQEGRGCAVLPFQRVETPENLVIVDEDGDKINHGWRCTSCRKVFYGGDAMCLSHECNEHQAVVWTESEMTFYPGVA